MNTRVRLLSVVVTVSLAFALGSCRRQAPGSPSVPPGEQGNYVHVGDNDAEMNAAMQRARNELDSFIRQLQHPAEGQEFSLKAGLPTDTGGIEHIWVGSLSYKDGAFYGKLDNEPVEIKALKPGDPVTVTREQVSDWAILEKGSIKGGYTIEVLNRRGGG